MNSLFLEKKKKKLPNMFALIIYRETRSAIPGSLHEKHIDYDNFSSANTAIDRLY